MNQVVREPEGVKAHKLWVRVVTAVLYGAVLLAGVILGPKPLGIVMGVIAGFVAAEFFAITRHEHRLPNEFFGVAAAVAMPIAGAFFGPSGVFAVLTALVAASLLWHVVFVRVRTVDTALTVFGAVYTGFLLSYLVLIREFDGKDATVIASNSIGLTITLVTLASVWLNDSLAYLVGSSIGRHKMAPLISPNKSWEGFFGGALASVGVWVLLPFLPAISGGLIPDTGISLGWAAATGAAVALAAVVGDLAESRFKREAGVKDSGTLLPGHGGFLDRHDSLILVCLVAWWMLWWGGMR